MVIPQVLTSGTKIAIVAPAGKLKKGALDRIIATLENWGLQVVLGKHVYDQHNYFAGTDDDRLADLQTAIDNPEIKAIICGRGGYGTTRILSRLDLKPLQINPKWVVGFSDITALHLQINRIGIASIHGPMGTSFAREGVTESLTKLKELLLDGKSNYQADINVLRTGQIRAEAIGGNLSMLIDSMATADEIDTAGKILFLEEIGEKPYRVDRMMHQLLRAGKLDKLAGLIIGQFSETGNEPDEFGQTIDQIIAHVVKPFTYPVAFGFSFGHEHDNMPIVMGGTYALSLNENRLDLSFIN